MSKFKRFLKDDNGMELIQVAIVIAITVLLAGLIWGIINMVSSEMSTIQPTDLFNPQNGVKK